MLADAQPSCYVHQHMRIHKSRSNSRACGEQVASEASTRPQIQQIKLALDVHAASIVVVRMIDGAKPQPPQNSKPADESCPAQPATLHPAPKHFGRDRPPLLRRRPLRRARLSASLCQPAIPGGGQPLATPVSARRLTPAVLAPQSVLRKPSAPKGKDK